MIDLFYIAVQSVICCFAVLNRFTRLNAFYCQTFLVIVSKYLSNSRQLIFTFTVIHRMRYCFLSICAVSVVTLLRSYSSFYAVFCINHAVVAYWLRQCCAGRPHFSHVQSRVIRCIRKGTWQKLPQRKPHVAYLKI